MAFIGFLVFWAISFVAGQLLRAVTAKPPNASPDTPDQPRTEEGGQIPAIFGTVKLGPTIVWWGDVKAVPVKKRVATSLFTSKRQTIAYKYLVGMQGGLCWGPVDEVVDIILADKKKLSEVGPIDHRKEVAGLVLEFTASGVTPALPLTYAAGGTAVTLDAPFVFGGAEKGGGVSGTLRVYFGSATQNANSYLTTQTATSPFPTYRGLCYAVWEQVNCGQGARIEPWQFVVRRCPTALGVLAGDTALSRIGDDANPAEVIYELWTNTRWGLGESASALDLASFTAALSTLATEGLGISGTHLGGGSADETLKEILRTIDGVLATDPLTGKLRLTLIRADYTVEDLEVFDASNSNSLTTSRPDWDELTTEVKVRYTDTSQDFTTRARPAYNPAVRQALGKARGVVIDYPLITTGANAGIVALRDLKSLSSTLAAGSIVLPRVGATLAPGDPFVINYPDKGLTSTVVRATRVNYGTINGKEAVECQWAEDVFGVTGGVFVTDPPSQWEPGTPPSFGNVVVIPTVTMDDTQVCVTLAITGQVSAITTIEMQGQEGGGTATGWTAFDIDDPPTLCVNRDDTITGTVAWRVTVLEPDGTTDTIEDEVPVPPLLAETVVLAADSITTLPIFDGGWLLALKNQPAARTAYFPRSRPWFDATGRTHIRVIADVDEAGATDSVLVAKFLPEGGDPEDLDAWADAGQLGTEVAVPTDVVGPQRSSGWLPLDDGAIADVMWQVFGVRGDGVATPVVGKAHIQFRTGVVPEMEQIWWRALTPAADPGEPVGDVPGEGDSLEDQTAYTGLMLVGDVRGASGPFSNGWSFCDPALGAVAYDTPTAATIYAGVGRLSPTKSTSDSGVVGVTPTCPDVHMDATGPLTRFVGRPLAAQSISAFAYEHWFSSAVFTGVATGTVASRLWLWRPGVGRVLLYSFEETDEDDFTYTVGVYAQSTSGGAGQKYVLSVNRVCRNWGTFPACEALEGDRFVIDLYSYIKTDCGFADQTQGFGAKVGYNGTTEPGDPEGLAPWTGTAAYTNMPAFVYSGDT